MAAFPDNPEETPADLNEISVGLEQQSLSGTRVLEMGVKEGRSSSADVPLRIV
jgi:hypothetical protein